MSQPPISAFQTESTDQRRNWKCYGQVQPIVKFYGKSLGIEAKGIIAIEFPEYNETYSWRPASCIVHNVVIGTTWFEYYGSIEVACHQTGYKAILNFRPYSKGTKELNKIDGYIYDDKMKKLRALFGDWTDSFYSCDVDSFEGFLDRFKRIPDPARFSSELILLTNVKELWRTSPKPDYSSEYYNFSYFTMSLNQIKPEFEKSLPPTDSRFRPDVRQLELGNTNMASKEKSRLEEKQREAARKRIEPYKGQWFHVKNHSLLNVEIWSFNEKYWNRDYSKCPDLF